MKKQIGLWCAVTLMAVGCGSTKFSSNKAAFKTQAGAAAASHTLTSIAVTPASPTVSAGDTQQFTATATYDDGSTADVTTAVTWAADDTTTADFKTPATVGLATALKVGTAKISATSGSTSGNAVLTVTAATLVSIAIVPGDINGKVGDAPKLKAIGTYSDGTTADITDQVVWASSDSSVASSTNGVLTGAKAGTTTITATLGSVTGKSTATFADTPPSIKFGLLFDDMACGMCHLDIHGTIISIGDVAAMRDDSSGHVYGKWLVSGAYHATDGNSSGTGAIIVDGQVSQNYNNAGKELPVDATGKPSFPILDFTTLPSGMHGRVTATATGTTVPAITKVYTGNTVLVGTQATPIVIDKDVLITGDLIIKGVYSGVGTIYATGNVYIPANLVAAKPAQFPYSDTVAKADVAAAADIAAQADALGLAAGGSIFIADLRNYDGTFGAQLGTGVGARPYYQSIFTAGNGNTPAFFSTNTGMERVYQWQPEATYQMLYENVTPCSTFGVNAGNGGVRAFNRIDAFLYSPNTIGGVARGVTFAINGGVIAKAVQILSDSGQTPCGNSSINYDARLRNGGLPILEHLAAFFPATSLGSAAGPAK